MPNPLQTQQAYVCFAKITLQEKVIDLMLEETYAPFGVEAVRAAKANYIIRAKEALKEEAANGE